MPAKSKWTILTYIAAHNNLDALGNRSLDQILQVGSTVDVVHGVLYDGQRGAALYIAGDPGLVTYQEPLHDYDSGDPDRLVKTTQWVFGKYRADHYGLILWSHGSGWEPEEIEKVAQQARGDQVVGKAEWNDRAAIPGTYALFRSTVKEIVRRPTHNERAVCFDDGTGHSLDTLELHDVTRQIQGTLGQPLDFLGMDACLMASLEVAYQLRETTRCVVASEELVPGHSWPYDLIYGALRAQPDLTPQDLAKRAVQDYVSYYSQHPPKAGDVTLVALDLSRITVLSDAVRSLAAALRADMATQADVLWRAQSAAMKQEVPKSRSGANKFQFSLWDLGSLARRLAAADRATGAVRQAAADIPPALEPGGAVLAEDHRGEWFEGIGGVTIYLALPDRNRRISPDYHAVALAKETQWNAMLEAYHQRARRSG